MQTTDFTLLGTPKLGRTIKSFAESAPDGQLPSIEQKSLKLPVKGFPSTYRTPSLSFRNILFFCADTEVKQMSAVIKSTIFMRKRFLI